MWARVEIAVRGAARRAIASIGTTPVSAGLISVAAGAYLFAALGRGGDAVGAPLGTTPAFGLLAAAILLDGVASGLRALRLRAAPALAAGGPSRRAPFVLAQVLLGLGLLLAFVGRSELRLAVAAGERLDGRPGQVLSWSPGRLRGSAALPAGLSVEEVGPGEGPRGLGARAYARLSRGGRSRRVGASLPLSLGWDSFVALAGTGPAPHFVFADEGGRRIDAGLVKLRVIGAGATDSVGAASLPHRIYLRRHAGTGGSVEGDAAILDASVFRGREPIVEGNLGAGRALRFEGVVLSVDVMGSWAELVVIRDPGLPVLVAAALAATAGAVGAIVRRRRDRGRGA